MPWNNFGWRGILIPWGKWQCEESAPADPSWHRLLGAAMNPKCEPPGAGCCGQTKPCSVSSTHLCPWQLRCEEWPNASLQQCSCSKLPAWGRLSQPCPTYLSGPSALDTYWGDTKHLQASHPRPGFFGIHLQECSHWPWQHPKCTGVYNMPQPLPPPLTSVLPLCPHIQLLHAHVPKSDRDYREPRKTEGCAHKMCCLLPDSGHPSPLNSWERSVQTPPFLFPPYTRLPMFSDIIHKSK